MLNSGRVNGVRRAGRKKKNRKIKNFGRAAAAGFKDEEVNFSKALSERAESAKI